MHARHRLQPRQTVLQYGLLSCLLPASVDSVSRVQTIHRSLLAAATDFQGEKYVSCSVAADVLGLAQQECQLLLDTLSAVSGGDQQLDQPPPGVKVHQLSLFLLAQLHERQADKASTDDRRPYLAAASSRPADAVQVSTAEAAGKQAPGSSSMSVSLFKHMLSQHQRQYHATAARYCEFLQRHQKALLELVMDDCGGGAAADDAGEQQQQRLAAHTQQQHSKAAQPQLGQGQGQGQAAAGAAAGAAAAGAAAVIRDSDMAEADGSGASGGEQAISSSPPHSAAAAPSFQGQVQEDNMMPVDPPEVVPGGPEQQQQQQQPVLRLTAAEFDRLGFLVEASPSLPGPMSSASAADNTSSSAGTEAAATEAAAAAAAAAAAPDAPVPSTTTSLGGAAADGGVVVESGGVRREGGRVQQPLSSLVPGLAPPGSSLTMAELLAWMDAGWQQERQQQQQQQHNSQPGAVPGSPAAAAMAAKASRKEALASPARQRQQSSCAGQATAATTAATAAATAAAASECVGGGSPSTALDSAPATTTAAATTSSSTPAVLGTAVSPIQAHDGPRPGAMSHQRQHMQQQQLVHAAPAPSPHSNNSSSSSSVVGVAQGILDPRGASELFRGTLVCGPSDAAGDEFTIRDCNEAHIYLLAPVRLARITNCSDCTICIGAVATLLRIENCERVQVTAAAGQVLVRSCEDCCLHLATPRQPALLSGCRTIRLAPFNCRYEAILDHLAAVALDPGGPNYWNKPLIVDCSSSSSSSSVRCSTSAAAAAAAATAQVPHSSNSSPHASGGKNGDAEADQRPAVLLLEPSEFMPLVVPFRGTPGPLAGGAAHPASTQWQPECHCTQAGPLPPMPFNLPAEYDQALQHLYRVVGDLRSRVLNSGLDEPRRNRLQSVIRSHFREWLHSSGAIRQVYDLSKLEGDECGAATSS